MVIQWVRYHKDKFRKHMLILRLGNSPDGMIHALDCRVVPTYEVNHLKPAIGKQLTLESATALVRRLAPTGYHRGYRTIKPEHLDVVTTFN